MTLLVLAGMVVGAVLLVAWVIASAVLDILEGSDW